MTAVLGAAILAAFLVLAILAILAVLLAIGWVMGVWVTWQEEGDGVDNDEPYL